jgi:FkbH-like protein
VTGRPATEQAKAGPGADAGPVPWAELLRTLREDLGPALWRSAARRLAEEPQARQEHGRRSIRIAVLAPHTTDFLVELLPVAGLSCGIDLTVEPVPFGQLETRLLDPAARWSAQPDYLVLWGSHDDLQLGSGPAEQVVAAAVERWTALWDLCRESSGAKVVQCLFAPPAHDVYGNGAAAVAESDTSVVARVNAELVARRRDGVLFVDCDALAARTGRGQWRDERHWDAIRLPVAPPALPALARALAGVLAADLGLGVRCLVLDLDNTLWGGVLGEEGIDGVETGGAFARFQDYVAGLRRRGLVLAVASKNDQALAERALEQVPGMRLRRADFAAVVADWRPKSEQLRDIAARLNLGTASLALVDDNPAECAEVAAHLPGTDVVALPSNPTLYVAALAGRPTLEAAPPTAADRTRTASYEALEQAEALRLSSTSLAGFLDSLQMRAQVAALDEDNLDRAAQLLQKTNQFNLTTRRHSRAHLAELSKDPAWRGFSLSLRDRFADHGQVGLLLLHVEGDRAEIDTLLLSCRVIGRTAERRLVALAAQAARAAGCSTLVGRYLPTDRNELVATVYPSLGFKPADEDGADGARDYTYQLDEPGPDDSPHFKEEQ